MMPPGPDSVSLVETARDQHCHGIAGAVYLKLPPVAKNFDVIAELSRLLDNSPSDHMPDHGVARLDVRAFVRSRLLQVAAQALALAGELSRSRAVYDALQGADRVAEP